MGHAEKQDAKLFLLLIGALDLVLGSLFARPDQHGGDGIGQSSLILIAVFVASWTLMIVAMMLPSSMPLVHMFQTMVSDRPVRSRLVFLIVLG